MKLVTSFGICPNCDIYQEAQIILDTIGITNYITFTSCKHTIFKKSKIDRIMNNGHEPETIIKKTQNNGTNI